MTKGWWNYFNWVKREGEYEKYGWKVVSCRVCGKTDHIGFCEGIPLCRRDAERLGVELDDE